MHARVIATLPASDIDRARAWYSETLGLEPKDQGTGGSLMYEMDDDTGMLVYPSQFAGTNEATACGFVVDEFDEIVAKLRSDGVTFKDVEIGDIKTENGVMTSEDGAKAAWFEDSEGNVIAVTDDPTA